MDKTFSDITDILKLGLDSQNRLAVLNRLVTDRIGSADHSHVHRLFEELLATAAETEIKDMAVKEKRLDEQNGELSEIRTGLLKEAELLRALRHTNDEYIAMLEGDLKTAGDYLKEPLSSERADAYTFYDTMQKRAQELEVTKNVAVTFSEQIRLAEAPLLSLSERILSVQMNLIPLMRGRLSRETAAVIAEKLRDLI